MTAAAAAATNMNNAQHNHHPLQQLPMDRVLFNLHQRCCTFALQKTSRRSRSWAEHSIMVIAVCSFAALQLAHLTFVYMPKTDGRDVRNRLLLVRSTIPTTCLSSIPGFVKETELTHLTLMNDGAGLDLPRRTSYVSHHRRATIEAAAAAAAAAAASCLIQEQEQKRIVEPENSCDGDAAASPPIESWWSSSTAAAAATAAATNTALTIASQDDDILFSYSREKGYLLLPPDIIERHGISVQYVHVSKQDAQCFGEPFLQNLVFSVLGADTVMINWLLGTYSSSSSSSSSNSGYIYNPRTRVMTDLSHFHHSEISNNSTTQKSGGGTGYAGSSSSSSWFHWAERKLQLLGTKGTVVIKTSFLFFITTTLVSFTLRETQGRMLDFTHHLQEHVRNNRPVTTLVTTHVVENLVFVPIMVGMVFFLIEFYHGDKFLAFMVLSLVWVCESFSVVSLRTEQGVKYFPLFFFLLFALFHYYHISFPWGFSYSALATTMCFMMHSMLFFWHRYELPAVALGRVSPERPRQGHSSGGSAPPPMMMHSESGRYSPEQHQQQQQPHVVNNTPQPQQQRAFGVRNHSFNTAASGRTSGNSSINGMYQRGDDDDDGSSVLYYLGGEVVIPRNDRRSASPFSFPSPVEYTTTPASASVEPRGERVANRLEPSFANAISTDEDSEQVGSSAWGSPREQPADENYFPDDDNETSALQAILNVMQEEESSVTNSSDVNDE